ncbi:MAG TPA: YebC/PmpR family DNA-binding transcriptional regulator [Thermoanaerobaculia bacterium]|nr:YebC/PmpR family DNA-binding transcriptional regulator [Thermoanaerobaculia bacterium]
MSGHSKWSTIKHRKAATDARRGKLFTKLLREITVAARLGGGDPKSNPRLRSALLEARSSSVPGDTIDRAIKKGTGELEGESYEEVIYEGYGPGGVAILVEGMTDNRNRTASEVRHLFTRHGGNLGDSGSVTWMFTRRGYFAIERGASTPATSGTSKPQPEDDEKLMELALELGVDDITIEPDHYELFTPVEDFAAVQEELERRGLPVAAKELAMVPQTPMTLPADRVAQVMRLVEALEDHDDVQKVWLNLDTSSLDAKVTATHS